MRVRKFRPLVVDTGFGPGTAGDLPRLSGDHQSAFGGSAQRGRGDTPGRRGQGAQGVTFGVGLFAKAGTDRRRVASGEKQPAVSPYLTRPRRSVEEVLEDRYAKVSRALEYLSSQVRVLSLDEVEKLVRLQAEAAALEREIYGNEMTRKCL